MDVAVSRCVLVAGVLAMTAAGGSALAGPAEEVNAAVARAQKAYNDCDADALARITDARFFGFNSDGSLQEGNDTGTLKAQCAAGLRFDFEFEVLKVTGGETWAVVAGTNTGTITPPDGQALPVSAHFTMVLVRQDGAWRSIHVNSSSNQ